MLSFKIPLIEHVAHSLISFFLYSSVHRKSDCCTQPIFCVLNHLLCIIGIIDIIVEIIKKKESDKVRTRERSKSKQNIIPTTFMLIFFSASSRLWQNCRARFIARTINSHSISYQCIVCCHDSFVWFEKMCECVNEWLYMYVMYVSAMHVLFYFIDIQFNRDDI